MKYIIAAYYADAMLAMRENWLGHNEVHFVLHPSDLRGHGRILKEDVIFTERWGQNKHADEIDLLLSQAMV